MKEITMGQFRKSPGYFLFRIMHDRKSYILTHHGKPAARLGPIDDTIIIESDGTIKGEMPLTMGRNRLLRALEAPR